MTIVIFFLYEWYIGKKKSVAIIGAGGAGLPAIKYFSEDPSYECVAFEQNSSVGGLWVYTEQTDTNDYGIPVHSAMYKSLRTNLPKQVMEYPGFHYKNDDDSYSDGDIVHQYLEDYAVHYGLKKFIKFNHHTKEVRPLEGGRWRVTVLNLETKVEEIMDFDQILVCTGNFCHPQIPNFEGLENFKGIKIHSFKYRKPSIFKDKKAVVVGCGSSGLDIAFELSSVASKVYFSHHNDGLNRYLADKTPPNLLLKGDIKKIVEDGVYFVDGSFETADVIIFCTGYKFNYPFLTPECGIHVENNHIQPLFKHIVNIEHPTMCLLGIPIKTAPFPLYDLQARFAKKVLSGAKTLPSKEDMLEDTRKDVEARLASGARQNDLHDLAIKSKDHFDDLANFADIEPIPTVVLRIFCEAIMRVRNDYFNFRKDHYKIVDNVHYMVKFANEENAITKKPLKEMLNSKKSVCIVGGGPAGLAALKNFAESDSTFNCTLYEKIDSLGGTWVYTDNVDVDQYGLPVHSSMYKNLRTNLPKEIMELCDFEHKNVGNQCYFPSKYMENYINDFADHFDLRKYIKLHHHVEKISPVHNDQWEVTVLDLENKIKSINTFDSVIICVGNYSNPVYPKIKGREKFCGKILHSHSYRDVESYRDNNVVVVGCGASGLDISFGVSKVAKKVFLSHHNPKMFNLNVPSNYFHKTDIKELVEDGVIFVDGSYEQVDAVIYCTGYSYTYPFLTPECHIKIENNVIKTLFKHMVNIEHPTMAFIGVPRNTTGFYLFDFQSKIYKKILEGSMKLPSKEEMYKNTHEEAEARLASGQREKDFHQLGRTKWAMNYYTSVTNLAGVEHPPPVLLQIYFDGLERLSQDFLNFRNDTYKILDKEHYTVKYHNSDEPIVKKQVLYTF
ncbi:uncharacterized protein LOC126894462 [Daktulosphaira vitifoliae]|uniref:uncharacterized protein LOC126894462 n=1 Tax=Daktulosphaira vitifoliae TaxID=58002 RepID=UPI0021A9AA36|nr:uncharacterized protein LOC126894462 [Daktulosphaira vitifoliae]